MNAQKRGGGSRERRCSHHVRLYSETMKRARRVVSQPHILTVSMVLALPAHLYRRLVRRRNRGLKRHWEGEHKPIGPCGRGGHNAALAPLKALLWKAMLFKELPSEHPKNKINAREERKTSSSVGARSWRCPRSPEKEEEPQEADKWCSCSASCTGATARRSPAWTRRSRPHLRHAPAQRHPGGVSSPR